MDITPEYLQKLATLIKHPAGTGAWHTELASLIAKDKAIKDKIAELWKRNQEAKKDYDKVLAAIAQEHKAITDKCLHNSTKYHNDPSGGRDSYTECNICGRTVSRYEVPDGYEG